VESTIIADPGTLARIEAVLNDAYLGGWERHTEAGRHAVENEVFRRFEQAARFAVPWVDRVAPLAGKQVLEVGCGSGSSTAAFARLAGHVHAYDIEPELVRAARGRCGALGLSNVSCHAIAPHRPLDELRRRHGEGVDLVLLYAVLEHCTAAECLETIRTGWDLLRPGGHLVVVESPNRFIYWDYHTAHMPFFHMLPGPIAMRYSGRSPRASIAAKVDEARRRSEEDAAMALIRLGTGISFQEFQLALGLDDLGPLVAADGYEPEMLEWFPITLEERLLQTFFLERDLDVPIGFARYVLNLILRKPEGDPPRGPLIPTASRAEFLTNFAHLGRQEGSGGRPDLRFDGLGEVRMAISGSDPAPLVPAHQVEVSPGADHVALRSSGRDPYLYLPPMGPSRVGSMMRVEIESPGHTAVQVYYGTADDPGYSEHRSVRVPSYRGRNTVYLDLPAEASGRLRLDPGDLPGEYRLHRLEIRSPS
jgi:S-adenosylmethionine-dependent methyltransferase